MATTTVSIDDRIADVRQIKLRLGSKTDIRVPQGAVSATIDLIGNPDQTVELK